MNTKNNARRRQSKEKIEKAFIELLEKSEIDKISVSDICKKAKINRSTFYANYIDIYDLADKIVASLEDNIKNMYSKEWESHTHSYDFLPLFRHIKDNQLFYKIYFKLDYNNTYQSIFYNINVLKNEYSLNNLEYHIEFFKSGISAIIKKWLSSGCKENPEEMDEILKLEYSGRFKQKLTIDN